MKTIRASEIGTFIFCQRAWWYHKQGVESTNQSEMAGGNEIHRQHGRAVFAAGCLRYLALASLLLALALLAFYLTSLLL
jgi:hypothetical protein